MKMKTVVFLIAGICLHFSLLAQDSTFLPKDSLPAIKVDTIKSDTGAVRVVRAPRVVRVIDSSAIYADSTIKLMLFKVGGIRESQTQNSNVIYGLLQGNRNDNKTKYDLIKNNLFNASIIYRLLNKGINGLKSKEDVKDLTGFVHSLSKPDNKKFGFSFDTQVMKMVTDILLEGKSLRNRKSKKIMSKTKSILESPIFRRTTSVAPSLGMANSIMIFFRSEDVQKYINDKNLENFEKQLTRYITYYKALNGADDKFNQELTFKEDQLSSLQSKLYYNLEFIGSPLGVKFPDTTAGRSIGKALDDYFARFTTKDVEQYFNKLETKYTVNNDSIKVDYERLLRDNMRLKEVNNHLESLVFNSKKFENLYNSYLDLIDTYCTQVNAALDIAGNYGFATQDMVKKGKKTLNDLKTKTIQSIRDSIDINSLQSHLNQIKDQQKVF